MLYSLLFSAIFWIIIALVREFGYSHDDTTNNPSSPQYISSDEEFIDATQQMTNILDTLE